MLILAHKIISVFIDKFRYNANRAAQVQSKIKGMNHTFNIDSKKN